MRLVSGYLRYSATILVTTFKVAAEKPPWILHGLTEMYRYTFAQDIQKPSRTRGSA